MAARPKIIELLKDLPDAAADRALAAGLASVEPEYQSTVVDILLQRAHADGLVAVIENHHLLGIETPRQVIASTALLFTPLRITIKSPALQTRLNSLTLIRKSRNPRLAYLAAAALNDGSQQVRAEAATTLRELTLELCLHHEETTRLLCESDDEQDAAVRQPMMRTLLLLREERQQLLVAIKDALLHYESHHRIEVVDAAMSFAEDLEAELFHSDPVKRGKLTQAMMETFTTNPPARFAPFAYLALTQPDLRRHVIRILSQLREDSFFSELIRHRYLARDPRVRPWLSMIRSLAWLNDGSDVALALPTDVAAMAPSWIVCIGLPADQKIRMLSSFLMVEDARVNLAAVWSLAGIQTPDAELALQGALDHDDPVIGRIAEHELKRRQAVEQLRKSTVVHGRPSAWSQLLDTAGLSEEFDDIWEHYDRIPRAMARIGASFALEYVPGMQTQLQLKLASHATVDRLRALKLIRGLYIVDKFTREVYLLANDAEAEIREAAMLALGSVTGHTSRRILMRGLCDINPVVQAAAIESLHDLGGSDRVELFHPRMESDHSVVRAAAVKSLLRMKQSLAAFALVSMLQDPRDEHRRHALGVIDQLRLYAIAPRIADIAESDPNPRIARMARHIHRRLIHGDVNRLAAPSQIDAETLLVESRRKGVATGS